ncbi:MAG: mannose-1-phosphate guanylyltransferase [Lachnospiraceae bacterium]|nr:mannose-1-phosphate guanylyltransferase [Lachnospiraceae bacterium]
MKVYGIIMAGGGGTRFWPLSRKALPKQFLNLTGRDILVNETFDRLAGLMEKENIFVITNTIYADKTLELMKGRIMEDHILKEPAARNTAACIGYAAMEIMKKQGDGVLCIVPSDHYIRQEALYTQILQQGIALAEEKDFLVTIGIAPTYPATGYGYIKSSAAKNAEGVAAAYRAVEEFVEKPSEVVAGEYLRAGGYSWNSGIFIWKASVILQAFEKLLPDIYDCLVKIGEAIECGEEARVLEEVYPGIPKLSIDYGIMERADNVVMLEGAFGWNDVGSLDALALLHDTDAWGNVGVGSHIFMDTEGTICYSKDKLIAASGVKDLIIVEAEDAILVCRKEKAQEVKNLVEFLKANGKEQYL